MLFVRISYFVLLSGFGMDFENLCNGNIRIANSENIDTKATYLVTSQKMIMSLKKKSSKDRKNPLGLKLCTVQRTLWLTRCIPYGKATISRPNGASNRRFQRLTSKKIGGHELSS